jgi:protein transport protein SEC61 subunit alpha
LAEGTFGSRLCIAYYMSPPLNFHDALIDPIHTLVCIAFVITACAVFSKI